MHRHIEPIPAFAAKRNARSRPRLGVWRTRAAWALPAIPGAVATLLVIRASEGGTEGAVAWVLFLSAVPLAALAGLCLALWLGRGRGVIPALLCATLLAPAGWKLGAFPVAYPGASRMPAALVRLPVDGPVIVFQGGAQAARNHHAALPNQRWAYDLVVPPMPLGMSANTDHGCWDTEVLAPASGVVVAAIDAWPDPEPGRAGPSGAPPGGNQVALRLEDGSHLFVAHLRRGSVVVREGETVKAGDVLGRCGNSGASDAPHIHLHRQLEPPGSPVPEIDTGLLLGFCGHGGPRMPAGLAQGPFSATDPGLARVFTQIDPSCGGEAK